MKKYHSIITLIITASILAALSIIVFKYLHNTNKWGLQNDSNVIIQAIKSNLQEDVKDFLNKVIPPIPPVP